MALDNGFTICGKYAREKLFSPCEWILVFSEIGLNREMALDNGFTICGKYAREKLFSPCEWILVFSFFFY